MNLHKPKKMCQFFTNVFFTHNIHIDSYIKDEIWLNASIEMQNCLSCCITPESVRTQSKT